MATYLYLQIVFFITEMGLLLFKRSKSSGVKNKRDSRSLLWLWLIIGFGMFAGPASLGFSSAPMSTNATMHGAGIAVFVIGFLIRWVAVFQLGSMFTVDVAITDTHSLKTNGLYQVVRHPSYTGLMLIIAGIALSLNSWIALILVIVPAFLALNFRIKVEERALTEEFGEQYIKYISRVKRLIPGVY